MESAAYWLATLVAFGISVSCSIAEGALLSYSPSRLEEQLKDPQRREAIQAQLAQVDRYVFSAIVLNAMSDVALVFACTLGFQTSLASSWTQIAAAVGTSMLVVLVGAEVVPRAFAAYYAEALVPRVLPAVAFADRMLAPITWPLRALHRVIEQGLRGGASGAEETKERRAEEIRDEIRSAALEGSREGVLDRDAQEMIEAVIDFRDVEVREILTPRQDMAAIEAGTSIQDAVKLALEQGHSRIPLYEGTRDKIVGVLYAKDLLVLWGKSGGKPSKEATLRSIARKPYFVPPTKLIGDLLREFRMRKVHIAIVIDEFGGVAGLVTIEDIIEEIVGEIEDEFDEGGEAAPLKKVDERTAEVDGKVHIYQVNEALSVKIPESEDYETLGGYLFAAMGRVPKRGDKHTTDEAEFTVLDSDERKIKRVRVQAARKQPAA